MTKRKFTPPTEFPAEYMADSGEKVTLIAKGVGLYIYCGQNENGYWIGYTENGQMSPHYQSVHDLHDIPKTKVHWANDYEHSVVSWYDSSEEADMCCGKGRIAVIRREWTEGELPKYFAEEV